MIGADFRSKEGREAAMALVDMFLKLDGVDGESPDPKHKGEIQIDGFQIDAVSPRDAFTNQAAGAVRMSHMTIRAKVDKSTPKLFTKISKNEKIPKAVLTCRKAGKEQFEYFTVTLSDVLVVKVHAGGLGSGTGDVVPQCEFDLAYAKIEMQGMEQTSKGPTSGPVVFMFNLGANA
jgi:type VI secretion system secreted protein Hcp